MQSSSNHRDSDSKRGGGRSFRAGYEGTFKKEIKKLKILSVLLLSIGVITDFSIAALSIAGKGPQLLMYFVSLVIGLGCLIGGITSVSIYAEMWYNLYSDGKATCISKRGKMVRLIIVGAIVIGAYLLLSRPVPV